MKKIIGLCAAFLCAYQISSAQTQKGNQNLGLNVDYSHMTSNSNSTSTFGTSVQDNKSSNFSLGPSYGYFIANGLELGANASYLHNRQSTVATGIGGDLANSQTNNGYNAAIYLRKYVLYDNKIGFRVGPFAGYGHTKETFTSTPGNTFNNSSVNNNSYNAGGILDLVYYPSNNLGITASLASLTYNHSKSDGPAQSGSSDSFGAHFINNGLALSVFYVMGSK